jgi:hypothetical protein
MRDRGECESCTNRFRSSENDDIVGKEDEEGHHHHQVVELDTQRERETERCEERGM